MAERTEADRIERACGLPHGTIVARPQHSVWVRPRPTEAYEKVDCALAELRKSAVYQYPPMSFIGNEYDGKKQ
jgi:hypothetical protein